MNESEARLLEFTKRWQRDKLSRDLAGHTAEDESDEGDAPTPAPLTRQELRELLKSRKQEKR